MTATQPTATEVIRVMRIEKIISLHYKDGFGRLIGSEGD